MIDTIFTAYFEVFPKDFYLLLLAIGFCFVIMYTIYNSIK
jgi:hypothetical protein